ncbi:uncharacterized protein LOC126847088 [Adelges cooleyi]|uniref:uncharacterized protein LOC126847088 n=1 Tax=Adelges cooleyi TaxID=133065 RepID=UPI0021805AF7|nr:uncharacterized protein LOC126847088 [Adelges cooleyi]
MDELQCLAPQLCIRCKLNSHVVSNTDACTCPNEEECVHNKMKLKKKTSPTIVINNRLCENINDETDDEESDLSSSTSSSSSSSSVSL